MAEILIDPPNRLITVNSTPVDGRISVDVKNDIYFAAKQYWKDDDLANKFIFPIEPSGGREVGNGRFQGFYYFLRTDLGWRIRPFEANHEVIFDGNLYPSVATDNMIAPTQGDYTVAVFFERSVLSQLVVSGGSGSGLTTDQDQRLVRIDTTVQTLNRNNP